MLQFNNSLSCSWNKTVLQKSLILCIGGWYLETNTIGSKEFFLSPFLISDVGIVKVCVCVCVY